MTTARLTETVRAERRGDIGVITLDRVKALNALTTEMVDTLDTVLAEWETAGLRAVVLGSASPKAFCAGGDIRAVQENSLAGDPEASERLFSTEYRLNARIADYPVPFVSLIDGICMGGGMGLSIHGTFRVVSGRAVLSMPETGIGFFPDVGASYFLSRLPGALGTYLGLTGARMSAADALYAGLATHYIDSDTIGLVPAALVDHPTRPVDEILRSLTPGPSPVAESTLAGRRSEIDWCFSADTLTEIDERLAATSGGWAADTRGVLARLSPQSLQLTLELLAWGKQRSLRECLDAELVLTRDVIRTPDFIEGIRAALVDKDRNPRWAASRFLGLDADGRPRWMQCPPLFQEFSTKDTIAMSDVVLYETNGPIATITLNRPDKLNALSTEVVLELDKRFAQAGADDSIKVVLLAASGRAFSAGFDINDEIEDGTETPLDWQPVLRRDVDVTMRVWSCPKPTIAVVQGYCLAGACEIAMACDIIVAAEDAKFGEPEIQYGSGPVTLLMPFILGQKKTNELLFTGDKINAEEALSLGLINKIVPLDDLESAARELAMRIAPTPLPILRLTKQALNRAYEAKGLRTAVNANVDISAILNGANTPEQQTFDKVAAEKGLKAALAWRDERYGAVKA